MRLVHEQQAPAPWKQPNADTLTRSTSSSAPSPDSKARMPQRCSPHHPAPPSRAAPPSCAGEQRARACRRPQWKSSCARRSRSSCRLGPAGVYRNTPSLAVAMRPESPRKAQLCRSFRPAWARRGLRAHGAQRGFPGCGAAGHSGAAARCRCGAPRCLLAGDARAGPYQIARTRVHAPSRPRVAVQHGSSVCLTQAPLAETGAGLMSESGAFRRAAQVRQAHAGSGGRRGFGTYQA